MSQIKRKHIRSKTIWQIFLMFLEISVIVGGLTWVSGLLWDFESGLDVLERVGLFYGFYQILTYIILSNLNDIKVLAALVNAGHDNTIDDISDYTGISSLNVSIIVTKLNMKGIVVMEAREGRNGCFY